MCEYSREHSCVYIVGIIQYWERVLISLLLSSDQSQNFLVKFPVVSRKFWASKVPRLGESEPKFQYWERVLISLLLSSDQSQNFLVKFPVVSRKFWASKVPRLGESEPKFPEEILGEEILPENLLVRDVFFFPRNF